MPIALVLTVGVGGIVLLGAGGVLGVALWAGRANTMALLQDKANSIVAATVQRVRDQLEPAAAQALFLSQVLEPADIETFSTRLIETVQASLDVVPQLDAIAVINRDGQRLAVGRHGDISIDRVRDPEAFRRRSEAESGGGRPVWGRPIWTPRLRQSLINVRQTIEQDDRFIGVVTGLVTAGALSRYLGAIEISDVKPFILYDRDFVIAHPGLSPDQPRLSFADPLPRLDAIGDAVLASIWSEDRDPIDSIAETPGLDGHSVDVDGVHHVFLYREIADYGPRPWTVGVHAEAQVFGAAMERLALAAAAGGGILILSLIGAAIVARSIGRPVRGLARAAVLVRGFDFEAVGPAGASHIRELDDAADAFNQMMAGLRWFETYVPRSLVMRLFRQTAGSEVRSEEREVTVLFTDIARFTEFSQPMSASETASLLNRHFALVNACIEAEEGTVDKYIGDGVMAFWGAPEPQPDHAARACRAARAAVAALKAENARRGADGLAPIRVRLGLHSGPVVVGNIGSQGRINYTIVGNTVNVAQRVEQLGKAVAPDDETCVLVTEQTVRAMADPGPIESLGRRTLRGWNGRIEIFRLDGSGRRPAEAALAADADAPHAGRGGAG